MDSPSFKIHNLIDNVDHKSLIYKEAISIARRNNIIIVSSVGDKDTISFNGLFKDEVDLRKGGDVFLSKEEVYTKAGFGRFKISVFWDGHSLYTWKFLTKIPHIKFTSLKNNKPWCEGIIIDLKKLVVNH